MTKTEQYISERLNNLERAFLQAQINNVKIIENSDKAPILADKVDNLNETMSTTLSGYYDANKGYGKDEYCMYNGVLYRFAQDNGMGIPPTNTLYWVECDIASELNRIITMIKEITV